MPDATAPGDQAPTTAERVAIARRAHADATARAQQAQQRAVAAAAVLRQAEAHRWSLVDRAATGSPIDQIAIARAKIAITESQGVAKQAALVAAGAITGAERAEIAALHAAADHLQAGYDAAARRQRDKAEVVGRAHAALQIAVEEHAEAARFTGIEATAIEAHNTAVTKAAINNAILGGMPIGDRPVARMTFANDCPANRIADTINRDTDIADYRNTRNTPNPSLGGEPATREPLPMATNVAQFPQECARKAVA